MEVPHGPSGSLLPSTQSNLYTKVAHAGEACSEPLQGEAGDRLSPEQCGRLRQAQHLQLMS